MLSFSWTIRSCKYHTNIFPIIILLNFFLNEKMNHLIQFLHEFGTWRNGVVFEILLTIGIFFIVPIKPFNKLFIISCTFKSSGSLIIHFGSWSDTIQSEEYHFIRLEKINDCVDVVKYLNPNLLELLWHNLSFEYNRVILR